ncbi:MAG: EscR/YscR/HrcR family type III secretion system export apparatus protein [Deltaproteobacteria bacterium]|nr:EscR/YscR/HrcR family type III secretion system export apparatus protein [Deltaproteobacteria bacterium]
MEGFEIFAKLGFSGLSLALLALCALCFSAYIKIVTVLAVLRTGLGWNSMPGFVVSGGLAIALSLFVMAPTLRTATEAMDRTMRERAVADDVQRARAIGAAAEVWQGFLVRQTTPMELSKFADLSLQLEKIAPDAPEYGARKAVAEQSFPVIAPAFFVSQLRAAFSLGLRLFLPLLVIDLLVATALVALGYDQLSPHVVSLPLKLILFVAVDGWGLITTNLITTFR